MFTLKKKYKVLAMVIGLFVSGITYGSGEEFMPVSEIREGMRGYAKTVVHGTKIETFDVDVLGIMKKKGANGGDLILVKVSGPLIDQTEGIAQGMSGSPVYIDGKLIGAVAYGFSQSGGRIGMVTPIFKNRFRDFTFFISNRHKSHKLCLQISGKSRIR